ncbi:hypothetical protein JB92DRAFT_3196993 [Gautieria morchelliformis]|nr:hypothetical protein JB92DRAFT_3196993 [Gautieria morchelliformis]
MSSYAANVARWNAIPIARESGKAIAGTKVSSCGEYDSSDADDVSLVSRSPSPTSRADKMDIAAYDEHHPAPEKEVITVETKIKSTNKGYSILAKLGWTDGQPLGLSGDGRVEPIPFSVKNDVTGLGKRAQDERMIETTVSQRRELDSERQIKETIEQRQWREQKAADKEALASQIASTLRPFYCALCDKQYQTVAQYDEHTNSYAHHHKQRFKDMQANAKGLGGGKQDKEARLAKERKREEKELKRMAKARGVKVGVIGGGVGTNALVGGAAAVVEEPKGFKKSGWATVSDTGRESSRKAGWANVSGQSTAPVEPPPQRRASHGFRAAGFETLETTDIDGDVMMADPRWLSTSAAPPPPPPSGAPSLPPGAPPPPPFEAPPLAPPLGSLPNHRRLRLPTLPHLRLPTPTTRESPTSPLSIARTAFPERPIVRRPAALASRLAWTPAPSGTPGLSIGWNYGMGTAEICVY